MTEMQEIKWGFTVYINNKTSFCFSTRSLLALRYKFDQIFFLMWKEYLGVVNVFFFLKKNYIRIDLIWSGRLDKLKDNTHDW